MATVVGINEPMHPQFGLRNLQSMQASLPFHMSMTEPRTRLFPPVIERSLEYESDREMLLGYAG